MCAVTRSPVPLHTKYRNGGAATTLVSKGPEVQWGPGGQDTRGWVVEPELLAFWWGRQPGPHPPSRRAQWGLESVCKLDQVAVNFSWWKASWRRWYLPWTSKAK